MSTETIDADKPDFPSFLSVGRLLNYATKGCNVIAEDKLAQFGITLAQWVLLVALWHKDGVTVGDVAENYQTSEPSTSNLIARMEKKQLVERRHDKIDRRVVRVFLTEKGRSLSHLSDFYEEMNTVLLQGFKDQEKRQFVDMLKRVIENTRQFQTP